MNRIYLFALFFFAAGCQAGDNDAGHDEHPAPDVEYLSSRAQESDLPFSEAVRVGSTLYLSGQIGVVPGTRDLVEGGMQGQTHQILENIKATLERYGSSMDHVVKCTVMIEDISLWGDFNAVYIQHFTSHKPARSAFGADGLALGAAVEVECIATMP